MWEEGTYTMSTSKLARLFAELIGTFALTAVVIAVGKNYGNPLFTTIAAAATLATMVSVLGPVSGGHFNPAITLGLFSVRRISLFRAVLYVAMQTAGAVLAWKFFEYLSPDRAIKVSTGEFDWHVFVAEMVGMLIFSMGVAAVVMRKMTGGQAGAVVGMSLFAGSVAVAVIIIERQLAGGIINPAIALANGFRPNNQEFLSYFFGPVLGAIVGMNLYKMFFTEEAMMDKATVAKPVTTSFKPVAPVATTSSATVATNKPAAKKTVKKAAPKKKTTSKK
jgi:aquaporin Z